MSGFPLWLYTLALPNSSSIPNTSQATLAQFLQPVKDFNYNYKTCHGIVLIEDLRNKMKQHLGLSTHEALQILDVSIVSLALPTPARLLTVSHA